MSIVLYRDVIGDSEASSGMEDKGGKTPRLRGHENSNEDVSDDIRTSKSERKRRPAL
jgi:hypothetical protein